MQFNQCAVQKKYKLVEFAFKVHTKNMFKYGKEIIENIQKIEYKYLIDKTQLQYAISSVNI